MLSTKAGYGQTTLKKLIEYLKDTFCTDASRIRKKKLQIQKYPDIRVDGAFDYLVGGSRG